MARRQVGAAPSGPSDAATKAYVDARAGITRDPAAAAVLAAGALGYDTVGQVIRIGDGTTRFDRLPYWQVSLPDLTAPSVFTVSAVPSQTTIMVSWTEATDDRAVTGYQVVLDGGATVTLPSTARTHTLTGLTASTAYTGKVRAVDAAGNQREITWSATTTAQPVARGNRTSYVGDSITQYGNLAGNRQYGAGWGPSGSAFSKQRLRMYRASGRPGEQSNVIADNFAADVLNVTPQPDVVCIMAGSNDCANGVATATILTNLKRMTDACKAAGVLPVVCKPPAHRVTLVNGRLNALSAALDTWGEAVVVDTNTTTKGADGLADPALMSDDVHPNSEGHVRMGKALAASVGSIGLPATRYPDSAAADNLVSKKGTTTKFSGSLATGALNARGYIDGVDQHYGNAIGGVTVTAVTNPWGGPGRAVRLAGAPTGWGFGAAWSVSTVGLASTDRIFLGCRLRSAKPWSIGFNVYDSSGATVARPMAGDQAAMFQVDLDDYMMGCEIPVGAEASRFDVAMVMYPAGTGFAEIGELFAFKLGA